MKNFYEYVESQDNEYYINKMAHIMVEYNYDDPIELIKDIAENDESINEFFGNMIKGAARGIGGALSNAFKGGAAAITGPQAKFKDASSALTQSQKNLNIAKTKMLELVKTLQQTNTSKEIQNKFNKIISSYLDPMIRNNEKVSQYVQSSANLIPQYQGFQQTQSGNDFTQKQQQRQQQQDINNAPMAQPLQQNNDDQVIGSIPRRAS